MHLSKNPFYNFGIYFSERPLKYPKRSAGYSELNFRGGLKILIRETLKVFLHPPPPSERESLVEVVWLVRHKTNLLSIPK